MMFPLPGWVSVTASDNSRFPAISLSDIARRPPHPKFPAAAQLGMYKVVKPIHTFIRSTCNKSILGSIYSWIL